MSRPLARVALSLSIVLTIALGAVRPTFAQPEARPPGQVVRIGYTTDERLQHLTVTLDVWHVEREGGYVVALVTPQERERLEAEGYAVDVDGALTAQLSAVASYPCYRTMDELYADLERLAAEHPEILQVRTIGPSYEGRPLVVARLTNRAMRGDKPVLFVMGGIHGRELITVETVMAFGEWLASRYGHDPDVTWILDHHEVHLLISANPDGHARNEASASYWRKNAHPYGACSNYGVDLNRNHTFKWNACSGCSSGNPCDWSYRGPERGSEPETRAIEAYVRTLYADLRGPADGDPAPLTTPGAFLTLHAWGNEVMWPWGWTNVSPPNVDGLAALARKLTRYNGYTPEASWTNYYTDGTSDDWAYGTLGVAALTFEIGSSQDGMYPPCSRYDALVQPNIDALLYAARVARAPYVASHGPDAVGVTATPDSARAGTAVALSATLNDSATGGQAIAAAEYAVGVPWWDGGPTVPLGATDGAFDGPIEEAGATVATDGWAPGRHTVWVRARDTSGVWGPPTAVWVTIAANASVEGRITSTGAAEPLAGAVVRLDNGVARIEARTGGDGRYSAALTAGAYTVTADAWGYVPGPPVPLVATAEVTATLDVSLDPLPLGALAGRVSAPGSGGPLPARVAAVGTPVSTTAGLDGAYVLPLPAGSYTVTATLTGYAARTVTGVAVSTARVSRQGLAPEPVAPVLLVDDDAAGESRPSNRDVWHATALAALGVDHDVWSVAAYGTPTVEDLAPYRTVVWLTGDARYDTLTAAEQAALRAHLAGGGALLLSGQHVARDIEADPGAFLAEALRTGFVGTSQSAETIAGEGLLAGMDFTLGGGDGAANAAAPAILATRAEGNVIARYGDGAVAGVAAQAGEGRGIILGFGLESLATADERAALLGAALAWLGVPTPPSGFALRMGGPRGPVVPGEPVRYALTLENATDVTRTGVVITDVVPAELVVASASPAATLHGNEIRWEGLSVAPGGRVEATVTGHLVMDATPGAAFENTACGAASDQGAARVASGAVRTRVAPAHDIALTPGGALANGWLGETATVALTATNRGAITDTVALSVSGGAWPATVAPERATLAPGQSLAMVLSAPVSVGASEGETVVYRVRAASAAEPRVAAEASVAVRAAVVRGRVHMPVVGRR